MVFMDKFYDEYLNILTNLEDNESHNDKEAFLGYEPTSYFLLEKIFTLFPFHSQDHLIDFGCGKGRVLFMAAYHLCKYVTGYEINEKIYNILMKNIESYQNKFGKETTFSIYKEDVQYAKISKTANKFFFFNPFYLIVYARVIKNIIDSLKDNERNIVIYLYRPHESTIKYLDSINIFHKEIFIENIFVSPDISKVSIPQFVIYSNYSMEHSLNEYSILL